jgi:hypothetical protein
MFFDKNDLEVIRHQHHRKNKEQPNQLNSMDNPSDHHHGL